MADSPVPLVCEAVQAQGDLATPTVGWCCPSAARSTHSYRIEGVARAVSDSHDQGLY